MSAVLPSVVLVPGASTSQKPYYKLISALKTKVFQVQVPALHTNDGQQPPNSTFDADIQAVRDTVHPMVDAGQEVILLMHSYGGVAGNSAIRNLARKDQRRGTSLGAWSDDSHRGARRCPAWTKLAREIQQQ